MIGTISVLLGGVGLFLIGMILMTDGLKAAAGSSLRRGLAGLAKTPGQALATGAGLTALVQSSSATTVATIGFVSAGMLTFPQALGVIMGANLGTTSTGWIVAGLGLKLSVGAAALPFVGVGALLRLLSSGRPAQLGMALAGFGLIFVGIDVLQEGMTGMAGTFDPASFPSPRRLGGIGLLILLGAATTVVLQSSSAAVATTLTALHAGTLDLPQAIYLVIGQNVGTTVTAALAAVGASVPARRTALAQILFNLVTAGVAVALLPLVLPFLLPGDGGFGRENLALIVAGFHTGFNVLGVLLFLPVVGRFSAAVIRLVPDRGPALTRNLDRSMLQIPSVALAATRQALREVAARLTHALAERLSRRRGEVGRDETDPALKAALSRIRDFLGSIETTSAGTEEFEAHVSLLHAADHIDRLQDVAGESADLSEDPETVEAALRVAGLLRKTESWMRRDDDGDDLVDHLALASSELAQDRRARRVAVLERTARRRLSPESADAQLHAMRWIDRLAYHTWRTVLHLSTARIQADGSTHQDAEEGRMEGAM